jgi:hypothetical protein
LVAPKRLNVRLGKKLRNCWQLICTNHYHRTIYFFLIFCLLELIDPPQAVTGGEYFTIQVSQEFFQLRHIHLNLLGFQKLDSLQASLFEETRQRFPTIKAGMLASSSPGLQGQPASCKTLWV